MGVSKQVEQQYTLDGVPFGVSPQDAVIGWEDVEIIADYVNDSIQPSLSISNFIFPPDGRDAINQWIANGVNGGVGIFEGMPFQLNLFNNTPVQENFKAFIDFTKEFKDLVDEGKISTTIIKDKGLDNFFDQIRGTTYGYLEEKGVITAGDYTDIPYVVEKKFNLLELLMSAVILFLMIKELAESVEKLANAVADVAGLQLGGSILPPTAALGAALLVVLKAILIAVYVAILLLAIIELAKNFINSLVAPQRIHKAIKLTTALEKVANHFGYQFTAPSISEYENLYYLPSNPNLDEKTALGFISVTKGTQTGIPYQGDFGYRCDEMFELAKNLPYAKLAIIGNTIHLRPRNDPFWVQQSLWTPPDILIRQIEYNTTDLRADNLITFQTDLNDEWTIDNYGGTAYEVRTEEISVIRKRAVLIKGLDEINFNVALGNRKDNLNALEKLITVVAKFIDDVTGVFGGGTNFGGAIENHIGDLKQSSNWHSVPKLIYLTAGKIPLNHRASFNTKVLWDKYHKEKSFVSDNFRGQKKVYRNVDVPFGFKDYQQLTTNSYFVFNGSPAKIIKFAWSIGKDKAKIDFWVREIYTKNLKEILINPS